MSFDIGWWTSKLYFPSLIVSTVLIYLAQIPTGWSSDLIPIVPAETNELHLMLILLSVKLIYHTSEYPIPQPKTKNGIEFAKNARTSQYYALGLLLQNIVPIVLPLTCLIAGLRRIDVLHIVYLVLFIALITSSRTGMLTTIY